MAFSRPASPRRRLALAGLALLLLAAAGGLWWLTRPRSGPDMVAVLRANSRGVGHMEQFLYPRAVEDFEEVVRLAPDWLPGQINLGIALLNTAEEASLDRALSLFEAVLRREPDNPHAHYCLGILLMYRQDPGDAREHFRAVTRKDPGDAAAWYNLGKLLPGDSDEALAALRRAVELDPHLSGALYTLAMALRQRDRKQAEALLAENEALRRAGWDNPIAIAYTEMGRYADVIGRPAGPAARGGPLPLFERRQDFTVRLAPGARWAKAADFGPDPVGELRARVRERFGATVAVLDYDGDGRPDLFLAGAVVEGGQVRDMLLRNEGGGRFSDVTAAAGLAGPHPTLGCCVADFDNDGRPDLLLTGVGPLRLFRNAGAGRFEDVTARAGLDSLGGVCLGAAFVDLDQDGDLDLLVAEYAATPADALQRLRGQDVPAGGGWRLFLNIGEAPPAEARGERAPLRPAFRRAPDPAGGDRAAAGGVAAADLDDDRDLDLLLLADGSTPAMLRNYRLLRFKRLLLPDALAPAGGWNGALVLDADHDGRSDLFLVRPGRRPQLLLNRLAPAAPDAAGFEAGATNSPPLLQAVMADLDLDGWSDVVGLSAERRPVLLHNQGGRLVHRPEALGAAQEFPPDLIAVTVFDADGDCCPDVLVWSEGIGLQLYGNRGNGNQALQLELTGLLKMDERGNRLRSNADGFGARLIAQAGDGWACLENTTLSAGLGQSRQPLLLGLGRFPRADVLRVRWPDGVQQAELDLPACGRTRVEETNRKTGSCPVLFTWDGRRFVFVTDFLGAGTVGELGPDGSTRPPRPEESVKIEPEQLRPLGDAFILKVAQPGMDEVTYLDRLQLVVLDHPADVHVYPDERFAASGPPPSQELFAFRRAVFPERACDHRGRDVTAALRERDRVTVDGFRHRSWLGFAEEHAVELDFGDRLAGFGPGERLFLCLAGWTDYPYPEAIWAAHQAGVAMQPPVLERRDGAGRWRRLAEAGFPAGLPRVMTVGVTGLLGGPACRLRLRTNLQVYWDQAFVAAGCQPVAVPSRQRGGAGPAAPVRAAALDVHQATLSGDGMLREYSPDGRPPTVYDAVRTEVVPVVRLAGNLTRYGDVAELLRAADDRFMIFGPDDVLTVRFDARRLPPLPEGWRRSFVLRTWGFGKDAAPFTAAGATVEPLPFRAMRGYPYGPGEHYPDDPPHRDYRRRYNTRAVRPDTPGPGRRGL